MTSDLALEVSNLNGWYGQSHVLHGVLFQARLGEVDAILRRNGAVASSTLRAVSGVLARRGRSVRVRGVEAIDLALRKIARLRVGSVVKERAVVGSLTVQESLLLRAAVRSWLHCAAGRAEPEVCGQSGGAALRDRTGPRSRPVQPHAGVAVHGVAICHPGG